MTGGSGGDGVVTALMLVGKSVWRKGDDLEVTVVTGPWPWNGSTVGGSRVSTVHRAGRFDLLRTEAKPQLMGV